METLLQGAIDDTENRGRFLHKIDTQVARLVHLIEELLTLARIEASEARVFLTPIDWGPIVREVVARYDTSVFEKGLRLMVDIAATDTTVRGHAEALSVITSNLLDNAIKYSPQDGEIVLTLANTAQGVCLSVADTGVGIPAHEQERIFERFYRVDKSRTAGPPGTGLGLAIVKHLTQALKGSITVESTEGHGSRFFVVIPPS